MFQWNISITSEKAFRSTDLVVTRGFFPGLQQLEFEIQHFSASIAYLMLRKECCYYGNSVPVHSRILLAVQIHYILQF